MSKESTCNAGDPSSIPESGRSTGEGIGYLLQYSWISLVVQQVKKPPAKQETWVQSLGWENTLEKGKAYPHQYSGLENSMNCIVHGVTKSRTRLNDFHFQLHNYNSKGCLSVFTNNSQTPTPPTKRYLQLQAILEA